MAFTFPNNALTSSDSTSASLVLVSDCHLLKDRFQRLDLGFPGPRPYPFVSLRRLLDVVRTCPCHAVIATGDISHDGSADSYAHFEELSQDIRVPVYLLPGNHDSPRQMLSSLPDISRWGTVLELNKWRLVLVNSTLPGAHQGWVDTERLRHQLDRLDPDAPTLLFMHHHPCAVGVPELDLLGLSNGDAFLRLVRDYPQIKGIFHGHVHTACRIVVPGRPPLPIYAVPSSAIQVEIRAGRLGLSDLGPGLREVILHPSGEFETAVHWLERNPYTRPHRRASGSFPLPTLPT